ncbi:MAG: copper resistance protein B [Parvibaculum sp.]|uniref:copper resistance protein B n=1 Tax=Parvibaculum sp. TaxID=2024848 RepID=UPI0025EC7818|nr:copper resistance protein B [Parvibaculum sp.]MCE9648401.1 copper resistance protein B [Parvibaculum sp.]
MKMKRMAELRAPIVAILLSVVVFSPARAEKADHQTADHEMPGMDDNAIHHAFRFQIDGAGNDQGGLVNWEGSGWIGGDVERLALKTEGEMQNGHVERSELWALYSRNVATFWDLQAGVRQDFDPRPTSYLVAGVQGLMSYFLETDAHVFLSTKGDASARLEQSIDLPVSQHLILEPHLKIDFSARDVPERGIGTGLSTAEAGVLLRYEITRKFAPYLDLVYERALGNTARFRRADGEDPGDLTLRAGIRFLF